MSGKNSPKKPSDDKLSVNEEISVLLSYHSSAWGEINTRIASRQTVQLAFVTITLTFCALAFSVYEKFIDDQGDTALVFLFGSLLATALSWVYFAWTRHNEGIIGLLVDFNKSNENQIDTLLGKTESGWNNSSKYTNSLIHRRWSDRVMYLMHSMTAVPSILALASADNLNLVSLSLSDRAHLVLVFLSILPVYMTYLTRQMREK